MFMHLLLSVLVAAPAVWSHPGLIPRAVPQVVYSCQNQDEIALTFDDGPYIYLRQISDAFTAANASATFFMNGNNWDCIYEPARMSDVEYAYKAGHMIGSHTWGHTDLTANLTHDQINDQMFRMEQAFSRIIGVIPAFMRPPYGNYNDDVLSVMSSRGQSAAMWDTDTGDADGNTVATSESVYDEVANSGVQNALILEHETLKNTTEQLVPYAIKLFQSKGFKVSHSLARIMALLNEFSLLPWRNALALNPIKPLELSQLRMQSTWTCKDTPAPGAACGGSIPCQTAQVTVSPNPTPTPTST
ncbi:hypothetical protein MSAN_01587400 [Mycena sanguinolenta]|uniref:NodB homology domain-containing protein n=1 Tax=Mycena sanguinolenta TaxID=230812 RepID=A0A8H7CV26_9AGAR|nr:hypothetical protein MSAN_01587400 [Mycena sanguinolenta]